MSHEGGKPVNVKVAVRCRCVRAPRSRPTHDPICLLCAVGAGMCACSPQNEREKTQRAPSVVRCDPSRSEIHVNQQPSAKKRGKTYTFDNVFGQYAEQKDVYATLVRPIVNEVLDGFNCTVFAYGQTGCGRSRPGRGSADPVSAF